jgi:hypothetical protein
LQLCITLILSLASQRTIYGPDDVGSGYPAVPLLGWPGRAGWEADTDYTVGWRGRLGIRAYMSWETLWTYRVAREVQHCSQGHPSQPE